MLSAGIGSVPLLNQCLQFGELPVMARLPGISLLQKLKFGPFFPDPAGHWWVDSNSGLQVKIPDLVQSDLSVPRTSGRLQLRFGLRSRTELFVFAEATGKRNASMVRRLVEAFGIAKQTQETPWLDEWTECNRVCDGCPVGCDRKVDDVRSWRWLNVTIESPDFRFSTRFSPSWIDRDGTVVRLCDEGQRFALHVDLASHAVQLNPVSHDEGELRFFGESVFPISKPNDETSTFSRTHHHPV